MRFSFYSKKLEKHRVFDENTVFLWLRERDLNPRPPGYESTVYGLCRAVSFGIVSSRAKTAKRARKANLRRRFVSFRLVWCRSFSFNFVRDDFLMT